MEADTPKSCQCVGCVKSGSYSVPSVCVSCTEWFRLNCPCLRPRHVVSFHVPSPAPLVVYTPSPRCQDSPDPCYRARLRIQSAGPADELEYTVIVESELGSDRHPLTLQVKGQWGAGGQAGNLCIVA